MNRYQKIVDKLLAIEFHEDIKDIVNRGNTNDNLLIQLIVTMVNDAYSEVVVDEMFEHYLEKEH